MKGYPVVLNTLWLIVGKFLRMVLSVILGMLTARYLGPADFGILIHASAYTGFFCAVCTLGLDAVLVRELADDPEKSGVILGTAMTLRGISSILSMIAILCIVATINRENSVLQTTAALLSLSMVVQTFEFLQYWFQSRLQSKVTVNVTLAAAVVTAGYKLYLLWHGTSVFWFASAVLLEQFLTSPLLLSAYRKNGGAALAFSREMALSLLRKSCHFILPGLMVAIYAQTDKIMLGQMTEETEIGYYAAAGSVCNAWCFVLVAVIESASVEIAKAFRQTPAQFDRRNRQLYAVVFYLSGMVSLLLCLMAKPLIHILYGDAYLPAVGTLRILTWHTGFSYLGVARNTWVVCKERQRYLIWGYLAAAVSNVALNFLLVPQWGAAGAAAASLLAQMVTTIAAPLLIPKLRENGVLMLEAAALQGVFSKEDGG